jgi:exosortase E/protease (VPEID-CTERM system)
VANDLAFLTLDRQRIDAPLLRWSALATLLLAQLLILTLRFDSITLAIQDGWWARAVEKAQILPQLAIVMLTATFIFGGSALWSEIERLGSIATTSHSWWKWCVAELALFIVFVPLTALVFEGQINAAHAVVWHVLWWLLVPAIIGASCCAVLPPQAWRTLFERHWFLLLGAMSIGGLAWGAGQAAGGLWMPLGQSTMSLVAGLLRLVTTDVVLGPGEFVIGTSSFSGEIAAACSGYEGIGLASIFVGTYLWWRRNDLRWPNAWLLLPLAIGLIWLSNGLRLAGLILIGSWGWREIAVGGFHSQAGWLAFNAVALGIVVASQRSRFFSVNVVHQSSAREAPPTAAYLMPLLALVATLMVTGAMSNGFDWLYPLRIIAVAAVVAYYFGHYRQLNWTWSWSAVGLGGVAFVLWMALEPAAPSGSLHHPIAGGLAGMSAGGAAMWLVFRVIGSVFAVPLAEELAFRGYLMRRLLSADFSEVPPTRFSWFALAVSSALFGALHPGRWLAGTMVGAIFGLALYRRGNVLDAVLAHATTNALIAVYVLSTGSWSLWT